MVSSFLLMGSPLSNATIILRNQEDISYTLFVPSRLIAGRKVLMRYLPIEINEKKYKTISKMNHTVARIRFQLTAIMNLRGIVDSHITTGNTEILVKQPYSHRYVYEG